jgi:hypothetical protein
MVRLIKEVIKTKMGIEHRWNDTDFEKKFVQELFCPPKISHGLRNGKSNSNVLPNFRQYSKWNCVLDNSKTSPVCPPDKRNMYMKTSTEHWWNDTERGQQNYEEVLINP